MAVAVAPFFFAVIPPIDQHFFNLVRMHILADPGAFAKHFVIRWGPIPDLAMDLTVPLLSHLVSVETASLLFIILTFAVQTSGALVLGRVVHGRWPVLPLLGFLLLYNWILARGYANNLFSLALVFWALAAHISLRDAPVRRVAVSSAFALAIYICHLFPLGIFALVAGTWELGCLIRQGFTVRRTLAHAAAAIVPFVPPACLLLLSSTGHLGTAIDFGFLQPRAKLELVLASLTVGDRFGDTALLAGLCAAGALALARGWITCRPEWRLTAVVLCCGAFLMPFEAFASYGLVERFSVSAAFLLPCILELRARDHRLQQLAMAGAVLLFLFRVGTVSADWRAESGTVESYRAAFAQLRPGSVLFEFDQDARFPTPLQDPGWWRPPLDKIVALATLDGVLVPKLYLKPGQQPVQFRPEDAPLRAFQTEERPNMRADASDLRAWSAELRRRFPDLRRRFSAVYVAVFDPHDRLAAPPPDARLVATLAKHRIYRLCFCPRAAPRHLVAGGTSHTPACRSVHS